MSSWAQWLTLSPSMQEARQAGLWTQSQPGLSIKWFLGRLGLQRENLSQDNEAKQNKRNKIKKITRVLQITEWNSISLVHRKLCITFYNYRNPSTRVSEAKVMLWEQQGQSSQECDCVTKIQSHNLSGSACHRSLRSLITKPPCKKSQIQWLPSCKKSL